MDPVVVCRGCGRTIDSEFLYCPWCGLSRSGGRNTEQIVDSVFERLEAVCARTRAMKIINMEQVLDELESELARIITDSEKRK